jgi:hypothetical protein
MARRGHHEQAGASAPYGRTLRVGVLALATAGALVAATSAVAGGGTSISRAASVTLGAQESENTATDPTASGANGVGISSGCFTDLEYWSVTLQAGDAVTISAQTLGSAYNFQVAVFPPGTTDANISSATAVKSGFPSEAPFKFTAPLSGRYPIAVGPNCYNGADGPFSFMLDATPGSPQKIVARLAPVGRLAPHGSLSATLATASGSSVTLSGVELKLYGSWKSSGSATSQHLLATATSSHGSARFSYSLPASVAKGTAVELSVSGSQVSAGSPVRATVG